MKNKFIIKILQDKVIVNAFEILSRDYESAHEYANDVVHTVYLATDLKIEIKRVSL